MTTAINDIENAIQARFGTLVEDAESVAVQYPNALPISIDTLLLWVRLTILFADSIQVSIGSPGAQRVRHPGQMIAQIFSKIGEGTGTARELADKIRAAFSRVTADGVTYRTPSIVKVQRDADGKWWQINVVCPFYSDEIA